MKLIFRFPLSAFAAAFACPPQFRQPQAFEFVPVI